MTNFSATNASNSLSIKLWRGERMCLVGMDVADPEPDFVGFSIARKGPGDTDFAFLRNRINFDYSAPASKGVDGFRNYSSGEAPFQKFRWMDFPADASPGSYAYRVTKLHMDNAGTLRQGDTTDAAIDLDPVVYSDYLDVGFTRNFASSPAYVEKFGGDPNVIPADADQGLSFVKNNAQGVYQWLGFEAYDLIFGILDEVANDASLSLDVFAYDFNEPDILAKLLACKDRVRAVIDNSGSHAPATSAESQAAAQLAASAGADHVVRMHFHSLQHNKVLIVRKDGAPQKVLFGSTNFSFRGLYIQANNALVFYNPDVAALFGQAFELALAGGGGFVGNGIAKQWHTISPPGVPSAQFCFSPHAASSLSLDPVGAAIDGATSSVFFAIAFLNQIRSGPTHDAIDRLDQRPIFSYGIVDRQGGLEVHKPDGSVGLVDFAYLASKAPPPFSQEWSGGQGIHQHDKFVVTDFNTPNATVFTGSSNLSPSGETGNGDNLVMIKDQRVATSYALEALRIFDHLEFRSKMQSVDHPTAITLAKPTAISGKPAWFERFYVAGSQVAQDRTLFSR